MTQIIWKLAKLNCIELWKLLEFLRIILYLYCCLLNIKISTFLSIYLCYFVLMWPHILYEILASETIIVLLKYFFYKSNKVCNYRFRFWQINLDYSYTKMIAFVAMAKYKEKILLMGKKHYFSIKLIQQKKISGTNQDMCQHF